jgi:O-antigen/teichoic acid export membrane protein
MPRRKRILGGILTILAGSLVGQGLIVLSMPLLTRLFDPADFGLWAVFSSIVSILAVVATGRLNYAIPLPGDERDALAMVWAGIAFAVGTALALVGIGWAIGGWLVDQIGAPALDGYWWLVAVTVLALGLNDVYAGWLVRQRRYSAIGRRNVVQGTSQVVTQLGLGLAGARPLGLLVGLAAGRLVSAAGLVGDRDAVLRQHVPSWSEVRTVVVRYKRFPLVASWAALINSTGLHAPILVIAAAYGDVAAGLLGLTIRVVGAPASFLGEAVTGVFAGEASAGVRNDAGRLGTWVRGTVLRLIAIGVIPTAVLLIFGPALFAMVFGAEWREAGQFAQLLCWGYFAQFVVSPVSQTLLILEHQGRQLAWDTTRLVLTVGGPAACAWAGAPITTAVLMLSICYAVGYLLLYLLCVRAADAADRKRSSADDSGTLRRRGGSKRAGGD